jgi:hypothetical protein
MRSFAASFRLPTFCHPFMLVAVEVLSLSSARCPTSCLKKRIKILEWGLP